MAAAASSGVAISTKAKPRERPVSLSSITEADSTVPTAEKASRSSSLVVRKERFPTYSFVAISSTILFLWEARACLEFADAVRRETADTFGELRRHPVL
jgi:hypothetical protein